MEPTKSTKWLHIDRASGRQLTQVVIGKLSAGRKGPVAGIMPRDSSKWFARGALAFTTLYLLVGAGLSMRAESIATRQLKRDGFEVDAVRAIPTFSNLAVWRVVARDPGRATIKTLALNRVDSDAVEKSFPVFEYGIEQFLATPEHARAGRAEHLVTGERVEITSKRLHVDIQMWHALRPVDQDRNAASLGVFDDLTDRAHGAESVRDMRNADEKGLAVD